MSRIAIVVAAVLIAAIVLGRAPASHAARDSSAQSISYPPGWNLVSGPDGSTLSGADGFLYTLQPGDTEYELVPADSTLRGCWGYWAYFPAGGSLNASADVSDHCDVPTLPGQWVMLGNPSAAQTLAFSGTDLALSYSPGGGYQMTQELAPGQGAFAAGQRELTLGPIAPATPTIVPTSGAPQPQPALTPPPSGSPLPRPRLTPPTGFSAPNGARPQSRGR